MFNSTLLDMPDFARLSGYGSKDLENTTYAARLEIPEHTLRDMDSSSSYVAHAMEHMKRNGAIEIFDKIYGYGKPVVVETHLESWRDPARYAVVYTLHYRLTVVQMHNVTMYQMPVFTFENHLGHIEWKCPACGMINPIEHRYCGENFAHPAGCGRPRDEAR